MKKVLLIILKVLLTILWIFGGLITLTGFKLSGFNIGSWKVSAKEVQMFVSTVGDYLFWIWVVIGGFLIWKRWIKK